MSMSAKKYKLTCQMGMNKVLLYTQCKAANQSGIGSAKNCLTGSSYHQMIPYRRDDAPNPMVEGATFLLSSVTPYEIIIVKDNRT